MRVRRRYALSTRFGRIEFDPSPEGMERDEDGRTRAEAWLRRQAEAVFGMSADDVDEVEVISVG